jgi:hypothetical protein
MEFSPIFLTTVGVTGGIELHPKLAKKARCASANVVLMKLERLFLKKYTCGYWNSLLSTSKRRSFII